MPNIFKKSSWFILVCLLTLSLISYRWNEWINLPSHYVVEPYGDGIKSYLVPLYHIKFDKLFNHYDGMNYPYGENIVAADGLATVSFPLILIDWNLIFPIFHLTNLKKNRVIFLKFLLPEKPPFYLPMFRSKIKA